MSDRITQNTAYNRTVLMTSSADHITGKTGLTLTILLSKNGGAFATITPTVTELGNGRYNVALTSTHTNTLGALDMNVTATGADPADTHDVVVVANPNTTVAGYAAGQDPATLLAPSIANLSVVYVRTLFRLGAFPQTSPISPVRLNVGDTGIDIEVPLIDFNGTALVIPDNTDVTFTMKLQNASGSPTINAADAELTAPDVNGVRYARFSFSNVVPVPAAGDYTATFNVAGTTYPTGRWIPVTTVSQP